MLTEPAQPPLSEWHFVEELKAPLWTNHHWTRREATADEVDMWGGVHLQPLFPDTDGLLETAYADLQAFFEAGTIPLHGDGFPIIARQIETEVAETFEVEVTRTCCTISAGDSEGIRRGIFFIEELMRSAGGALLPVGSHQRTPVVRTRISRCFFGPIKRPPLYRDELTDDVDYYPDEYLNRLAHDGVNGLWLSIKFRELCPSSLFPNHGADAERRLAKLRRVVRQCARYGIKIYAFCIEPMAFGDHADSLLPWSALEPHPELAGHHSPEWNLTYFCTSSETGQRYLEESAFSFFEAVPGLGGLIDINLNERATHCYSSPTNFAGNNCPRCSKRHPAEVFADTLSALARGMQRANPAAEFISWLYIPSLEPSPESDPAAELECILRIAAAVPENVTLQLNFESLGQTEQCGRTHTIYDYSLAYVGPSELFRACSQAVRGQGARVSAKLQVGCSHEVATVPFVPVPGNLYRKYQTMHQLGVSTAMQCWYFGNYPSAMNRAAGRLAFAPLPDTEAEFLRELAAPDWGLDTPMVAEAWSHFRDAYGGFPATLPFSYFGPVHDSIAWPLHLFPVDQPIAPSWLLRFPPSGDRIGECFAPDFTLEEVRQLTRKMAERWQRGWELLAALKPRYEHCRERLLDIGVAEALCLQFRSAANTIEFYALREALPYSAQATQRLNIARMRQIVIEEIGNSSRLAALASEDSRLGFHSEAEGYKYFPQKLQWRIELLQKLLDDDFPTLEAQINAGEALFADYTGVKPEGPSYQTVWASESMVAFEHCTESTPLIEGQDCSGWDTYWRATADDDALILNIKCVVPVLENKPSTPKPLFDTDHIKVSIEPRRLWPVQRFFVGHDGRSYSDIKNDGWESMVTATEEGWEATITIPWRMLRSGEEISRPIRLNIERIVPEVGSIGWLRRHPLPPRLLFESENPQDLGWLLFG